MFPVNHGVFAQVGVSELLLYDYGNNGPHPISGHYLGGLSGGGVTFQASRIRLHGYSYTYSSTNYIFAEIDANSISFGDYTNLKFIWSAGTGNPDDSWLTGGTNNFSGNDFGLDSQDADNFFYSQIGSGGVGQTTETVALSGVDTADRYLKIGMKFKPVHTYAENKYTYIHKIWLE